MKNENYIKNRENLVYLILWVIVFAMPVFLSSGGDSINWTRIKHESIRIFPFFIIFLLNNFFLFRYFKNRKYLIYSVLTIIAVILFSLAASFNIEIFRALDIPRPQLPRQHMPRLNMPPPNQNGSFGIELFNRFFYNVIFSILVLGFNNAFKILTFWFEDRRNYEALQKEKLKTELEVLKNQISPHFLMNTLNNIHALIDYNQDMAKESIVMLSKLMRVLLYDSDNENYSIKNEIQFLNDYIGLMKIRVHEDVDIKFEYPLNISDYKIPPLLFVSFVENAFKHGIVTNGKSYVHIKLETENNNLLFNISNSKSGINKSGDIKKIGLENAENRFNVVYGANYSFKIFETNDNFTVSISIPLI